MELTDAQIAVLKARIAAAETRASLAKLKGDALEDVAKEMDKKIAELKAELGEP